MHLMFTTVVTHRQPEVFVTVTMVITTAQQQNVCVDATDRLSPIEQLQIVGSFARINL